VTGQPPARRRLVELAVPAVLVAGSLGAGVIATRPDAPAPAVSEQKLSALLPPGHPPAGIERMERALAENPGAAGMRLALVKQYLRAGRLAEAKRHAHLVLRQPPDSRHRQQALGYLGWATALLGEPHRGSALLQESIALDPGDLDARWFLANVTLQGLGDPQRAVAMLEDILRAPIPDRTRPVVEAKLREARTRTPGG
jgi:cytochrome c-type biogenesis protein CcmH/NrfG